jgi:hypothetical protein
MFAQRTSFVSSESATSKGPVIVAGGGCVMMSIWEFARVSTVVLTSVEFPTITPLSITLPFGGTAINELVMVVSTTVVTCVSLAVRVVVVEPLVTVEPVGSK